MEIDIYDEELPEIKKSWATLYKENKGNIRLVLQYVGIPAAISVASFTVAHIAGKKLS